MAIVKRNTSSRQELLKKVSTNRDVAKKNPGAVSPDARALDARISQSNVTLSDGAIYSTKDASGLRTLKMFESQDDQRAGVTNIAQGKTAKNQDVTVGAIQLLAALSPTDINGDPTTLAGLNYGSIAAIKGLENGVLTIRHRGKVVLDRFPLTRFKNSDNDRTDPVGELTLDSTIQIYPQEPIEANIDFGVACPNRTAIKLLLVGTQTIPA